MVFELPDEQPVEVTSPVTVSDQARHDLRSLLLLHHALGPLQERVVELTAVVRAQRRDAEQIRLRSAAARAQAERARTVARQAVLVTDARRV